MKRYGVAMTLRSKRELEVSESKLRGLEELYAKTLADSTENTYAQKLTLRSLRNSINQLKEEIARFESRTGSAAQDE